MAVSTTATLDPKEQLMTEISDRVAAARGAVRDRATDLDAAKSELSAVLAEERQGAADRGQAFTCPRRFEFGGQRSVEGPEPDYYAARGGTLGCSYCGSVPPAEFMDAVRSGVQVGPTDKSYKAYLGSEMRKFYYQHLSDQQRQEFVDLHNARTIAWGEPGYPYVLPFFMRTDVPVGG
jgi:hypothetical protein